MTDMLQATVRRHATLDKNRNQLAVSVVVPIPSVRRNSRICIENTHSRCDSRDARSSSCLSPSLGARHS